MTNLCASHASDTSQKKTVAHRHMHNTHHDPAQNEYRKRQTRPRPNNNQQSTNKSTNQHKTMTPNNNGPRRTRRNGTHPKLCEEEDWSNDTEKGENMDTKIKGETETLETHENWSRQTTSRQDLRSAAKCFNDEFTEFQCVG